MRDRRIYTEEVEVGYYEQLERSRLDRVEDSQLYNLLMRRTKGDGAEVLRAAVYTDLRGRLGRLGIIFTDQDLQPVGRFSLSSNLVGGYWLPKHTVSLSSQPRNTRYGTGYFVSTKSELEEELDDVHDVVKGIVPVEFL